MSPASFEISGCDCGNGSAMWSEFEEHLWCEQCQIDFKPKHNGVFSGPIPIKTAELLGLRFDRINLITQKVEIFNSDDLTYSIKD